MLPPNLSLELFHPRRKTALIIGSGIGGLSLGIRLQSLGFNTTILERFDAPGGRAYQRRVNGYTFDMGPTVITVPQFIEELFALSRDRAHLTAPDFPGGASGGHGPFPHTQKYVKLVPISPFYRIYFDDGTFFDYDGIPTAPALRSKRWPPKISRATTPFSATPEPSLSAVFWNSAIPISATCPPCSKSCRI